MMHMITTLTWKIYTIYFQYLNTFYLYLFFFKLQHFNSHYFRFQGPQVNINHTHECIKLEEAYIQNHYK